MLLIDGKETSRVIREELREEVAAACGKGRRAPGLAVILVGEDPASEVYVRNKERACARRALSPSPIICPRPPASTNFWP